ncbi:MAG: SDR family oxidoreductase [Chloroflexi bacterium]|nr:SDR family oxidoreductase [Chloroflexota bacterium]
MILIVGGTGALGSVTAEKLLAQREAVRIMTRTPAKAQALQALGADVVQGDLRDQDSLVQACQGVDAVLASAHSIMGSGSEASKYIDDQGHRWLINAAKAAGVNHFVYVSALGAAPDHPASFFRIKYKIEQYLRNSGLSCHILRPTAFMESHAYQLIGQPILETGKVTVFGKGENPRNFVAAADVAHFAVLMLLKPETSEDVLEIGGPENFTNMQVVGMYEELAGRKAKVSHVPLGMLRVMSPVVGPFNPGLSQVMAISIWHDTTDQTFDPSALLQRYPMTLTRLADWMAAHVPAELLPASG